MAKIRYWADVNNKIKEMYYKGSQQQYFAAKK